MRLMTIMVYNTKFYPDKQYTHKIMHIQYEAEATSQFSKNRDVTSVLSLFCTVQWDFVTIALYVGTPECLVG